MRFAISQVNTGRGRVDITSATEDSALSDIILRSLSERRS